MDLTDFEAEYLRKLVIEAAEREAVNPDVLPGWDLGSGWPSEKRGRLWRVEPIDAAGKDTITKTAKDSRVLCRTLSQMHDPENASPWALVPGRTYGEVWIVWPPDDKPPPLS